MPVCCCTLLMPAIRAVTTRSLKSTVCSGKSVPAIFPRFGFTTKSMRAIWMSEASMARRSPKPAGSTTAGVAGMPTRDSDHAYAKRVWVSARESTGLDPLTQVIREHFRGAIVHRRLRLPASAGRLRARLYELGTVVEEHNLDNGDWLMDVKIAPASLERLWRREGLPPGLVSTVTGVENCNLETDLAVADTPKAS